MSTPHTTDEPVDPAALDALTRDLEDTAQLCRAILWGVAFVAILVAWAWSMGWLRWMAGGAR